MFDDYFPPNPQPYPDLPPGLPVDPSGPAAALYPPLPPETLELVDRMLAKRREAEQ